MAYSFSQSPRREQLAQRPRKYLAGPLPWWEWAQEAERTTIRNWGYSSRTNPSVIHFLQPDYNTSRTVPSARNQAFKICAWGGWRGGISHSNPRLAPDCKSAIALLTRDLSINLASTDNELLFASCSLTSSCSFCTVFPSMWTYQLL